MRGVDAAHAFEVAAAHYQEPVETLRTDGADEALGAGVRLRCTDLDGEEIAGEHARSLLAEELPPARTRTPRRWIKISRQKQTPHDLLTSEEREELKRLRKENAGPAPGERDPEGRLRYFARELDRTRRR